mgnify:CR=1 FL=1
MNDFISRIFGGLLNILHFFVIGAISFAIFSENSQLAEDLGDNIAAKIFGGILVLFVYSIFIGLISYSLYLWHYPVLALSRILEYSSSIDIDLSTLTLFDLSLST